MSDNTEAACACQRVVTWSDRWWCSTCQREFVPSARFDAAEKAAEALRCVLPMAKGYAATHSVGNNAAMVADAEAKLAALDAVRGGKAGA